MTYVIAEPCAGTKDKSCVAVCPVDCIHEGVVEIDGVVINQLFINPLECIDCAACESECPVDAIFIEDEVPAQWTSYIQINAEFYRSGKPPSSLASLKR